MNNQDIMSAVALGEYVLITVKQSMWSGRMASSFEEDFNQPEKDRIWKLNKPVCPPKLLKDFRSIIKATCTEMDRYGLKFIGDNIWAIPKDYVQRVREILDKQGQQYQKAKDQFCEVYDAECENWYQENMEDEKTLRKGKLPLHKVREKFQFKVSQFQVANNGFLDGVDVDELEGSLYRTVSKNAFRIFKNWDKRGDQESLPQQSMKTLRELHALIKGFTTLSPEAHALDNQIEAVLSSVSADRTLKGNEVKKVYALVKELMDFESLKEIADGKTPESLLLKDNDPEPQQHVLPGTIVPNGQPKIPPSILAKFAAKAGNGQVSPSSVPVAATEVQTSTVTHTAQEVAVNEEVPAVKEDSAEVDLDPSTVFNMGATVAVENSSEPGMAVVGEEEMLGIGGLGEDIFSGIDDDGSLPEVIDQGFDLSKAPVAQYPGLTKSAPF